MSKILFLIVCFFLLFSFSYAGEGWEIKEEVESNKTIVQTTTRLTENTAIILHAGKIGKSEIALDFKNNIFVSINHQNKSYEEYKLSDYLDMINKMAETIMTEKESKTQKGTANPNIQYIKKGKQKVGHWNATHYLIKVDKKDFMKIWVAEDLKNSPFKEALKRVTSFLPDFNVKNKSSEDSIRDFLNEKGVVVKLIRYPFNSKLPVITTQIVSIEKTEVPVFSIPAGYKKSGNR